MVCCTGPDTRAMPGDHHAHENLRGLRLSAGSQVNDHREDWRQAGRGVLRGMRHQAARSQFQAEKEVTGGPVRFAGPFAAPLRAAEALPAGYQALGDMREKVSL